MGRLWIGTDWGINLLTPEWTLINQRQNARWPDDYVNEITSGLDGTLWAGSSNGILYRVKGNTNGPFQVDKQILPFHWPDPQNNAMYLAADHRKQVWFVGYIWQGGRGERIYRWQNGRITDMTRPLFTNPNQGFLGLVPDRANQRLLLVTDDGRLWNLHNNHREAIPAPEPFVRLLTGTDNTFYGLSASALYQIKGDRVIKQYSLPDSIQLSTHSAVGPHGEIAYTKDGYTIVCYDGLKTSELKTSNLTHCLLFDRRGNLWAGTHNGVIQFIRTGWGYYDASLGWQQETNSITEDKNGAIWFSSWLHGLSRLTPTGIVPDNQYRRTLPVDQFYPSPYRDADGNIFFSAVAGFGILRYTGNQFQLLPGSDTHAVARGFYEDKPRNRYIFSTRKGLFIYNRQTLALQTVRLDSVPQEYYIIETDRQGWFWLAGEGQIRRWDGDKRTAIQPLPPGVRVVFDLHCDQKGTMWLATDAGLWCYRNKTYQRVLPNDLRSIVQFCHPLGTNYLLLGTIQGLYVLDTDRFYKKAEEWLAFFDRKAGFSATQCTMQGVYCDSQKRWWFATRDRLITIPDPQLRALLHPVLVGIQGVYDQRTGQKIGTDALMELKPTQNELEVRLRESDDRNQLTNTTYTYQLQRLDELQTPAPWSEPVRASSLRFANLSDGNYQLTLRVLNAPGLWNTRPIRQTFRIAPPWWTTWWFRTLLALAVAAAIFYWRLNTLQTQRRLTELKLETARQQRQEAQMQQALAEAGRQRALLEMRAITNQIDPHFVANFLTAIQSILYQYDADTVLEYIAKFGTIFRQKLMSRMQVFWTLAEEIDFVGNYLELEQLRFENLIQYEIIVEPDVPTNTTVPKMLIQSYVSNAVKHGLEHQADGGFVQITVAKHNERLFIQVDDNGVGISEPKRSPGKTTGRGLPINQAIFDQLNDYNRLNSGQQLLDLMPITGHRGTRAEAWLPLFPVLPPEEITQAV